MHGEQPYIVREHIEGRSLAETVTAEGPLDGDTLERVAVGVLTALTAVHLAGVTHRGLTPHNVISASDGPRVTDMDLGDAAASWVPLAGAAGSGLGTAPTPTCSPGRRRRLRRRPAAAVRARGPAVLKGSPMSVTWRSRCARVVLVRAVEDVTQRPTARPRCCRSSGTRAGPPRRGWASSPPCRRRSRSRRPGRALPAADHPAPAVAGAGGAPAAARRGAGPATDVGSAARAAAGTHLGRGARRAAAGVAGARPRAARPLPGASRSPSGSPRRSRPSCCCPAWGWVPVGCTSWSRSPTPRRRPRRVARWRSAVVEVTPPRSNSTCNFSYPPTFIAYGANVYVTPYLVPAGTNSVLTSSDSVVVQRLFPIILTNPVNNITFVNGRFFLLSKPMLSSPDGMAWTAHSVPNLPTQIAYGNGIYVLTSLTSPSIQTSTNAVDWLPAISYSLPLKDITFGGSLRCRREWPGAPFSQTAPPGPTGRRTRVGQSLTAKGFSFLQTMSA